MKNLIGMISGEDATSPKVVIINPYSEITQEHSDVFKIMRKINVGFLALDSLASYKNSLHVRFENSDPTEDDVGYAKEVLKATTLLTGVATDDLFLITTESFDESDKVEHTEDAIVLYKDQLHDQLTGWIRALYERVKGALNNFAQRAKALRFEAERIGLNLNRLEYDNHDVIEGVVNHETMKALSSDNMLNGQIMMDGLDNCKLIFQVLLNGHPEIPIQAEFDDVNTEPLSKVALVNRFKEAYHMLTFTKEKDVDSIRLGKEVVIHRYNTTKIIGGTRFELTLYSAKDLNTVTDLEFNFDTFDEPALTEGNYDIMLPSLDESKMIVGKAIAALNSIIDVDIALSLRDNGFSNDLGDLVDAKSNYGRYKSIIANSLTMCERTLYGIATTLTVIPSIKQLK